MLGMLFGSAHLLGREVLVLTGLIHEMNQIAQERGI